MRNEKAIKRVKIIKPKISYLSDGKVKVTNLEEVLKSTEIAVWWKIVFVKSCFLFDVYSITGEKSFIEFCSRNSQDVMDFIVLPKS